MCRIRTAVVVDDVTQGQPADLGSALQTHTKVISLVAIVQFLLIFLSILVPGACSSLGSTARRRVLVRNVQRRGGLQETRVGIMSHGVLR